MSFDLDNLLGLLFFVVFIVLPIFSRSTKNRKGQQSRGQTVRPPAPGAPGQGTPTARSVPLPGQPTASADRGSASTITLEEIRRRVEEAQRREVESRHGSQASTSVPSPAASAQAPVPARRGLVSSDPFERTLVSATTATVMGREGAPVQGQSLPTILGREGSLPSGSTRAPGVLGREGLPGKEGPSGAARRGPRSTGAPGPLGREGAQRSARAAAAVMGGTSDPSDHMQPHYSATGSKLSPIGPLRFDKRSIRQGLIWHEVLGEPPSIKRLRRTRSRLH